MSDFGIIGIGRIGTSMARNMSSNGIIVSLFDKSHNSLDNLKNDYPELDSSLVFDDINKFISSISKPRKVLILVPSGPALDEVISLLIQHLDSNDILIDGGNTNPNVSFENHQTIKSKNLLYLGMGVSGGVKGVLISSIYYLMINSKKYSYEDVAKIFNKWNDIDLNSYLLEISLLKLTEKTDDSYLLDRIDDKADDNGTGRWMLKHAIDLGCSVSMLNSAIDSRFISNNNSTRSKANKLINEDKKEYDIDFESLANAYRFCRLINYFQAFLLMDSANKSYGWNISISNALNVWSNGSIIKSKLINKLISDFSVDNILDDKNIFNNLNELKPGIIDILNKSLINDVSLPCFNEALNYFNQISSSSLSTKLIQAQRNYFGSHEIKIN